MSSWRSLKLGELFRLKHGYAFKSKYYRADGDLILLTPGNFRATGGLQSRGEKEKYYEGPVPDGFVLGRDDLLVVMTDLTLDAPF